MKLLITLAAALIATQVTAQSITESGLRTKKASLERMNKSMARIAGTDGATTPSRPSTPTRPERPAPTPAPVPGDIWSFSESDLQIGLFVREAQDLLFDATNAIDVAFDALVRFADRSTARYELNKGCSRVVAARTRISRANMMAARTPGSRYAYLDPEFRFLVDEIRMFRTDPNLPCP